MREDFESELTLIILFPFACVRVGIPKLLLLLLLLFRFRL